MNKQGHNNSPRYQPCPKCHKGSKRVTTMQSSGFPVYQCSVHGGFLVRG